MEVQRKDRWFYMVLVEGTYPLIKHWTSSLFNLLLHLLFHFYTYSLSFRVKVRINKMNPSLGIQYHPLLPFSVLHCLELRGLNIPLKICCPNIPLKLCRLNVALKLCGLSVSLKLCCPPPEAITGDVSSTL